MFGPRNAESMKHHFDLNGLGFYLPPCRKNSATCFLCHVPSASILGCVGVQRNCMRRIHSASENEPWALLFDLNLYTLEKTDMEPAKPLGCGGKWSSKGPFSGSTFNLPECTHPKLPTYIYFPTSTYKHFWDHRIQHVLCS